MASKLPVKFLPSHLHQKDFISYLFYVVSCFCTCLNKHDIQLFSSLFTFFNCYLPGMDTESKENGNCLMATRKGSLSGNRREVRSGRVVRSCKIPLSKVLWFNNATGDSTMVNKRGVVTLGSCSYDNRRQQSSFLISGLLPFCEFLVIQRFLTSIFFQKKLPWFHLIFFLFTSYLQDLFCCLLT